VMLNRFTSIPLIVLADAGPVWLWTGLFCNGEVWRAMETVDRFGAFGYDLHRCFDYLF
jgi:hypothetical protein